MKKLFPLLLCAFIVSCKSSQKITVNSSNTSVQDIAADREMKLMLGKGIDFFGEGNIPVNWNLQMNYDDTVRFTAADGLSLKCGYNQLKKDINADRSIFSAKISGGDVTLIITEKGCTVPNKKETFRKQVTFTFNSRAYTGCGKFLADNLLNNKWMLEKIGNVSIRPEEYNRIPVFQFDIAQGRTTGNDGCNTISGKMEVRGNRIKFSPLISTKMACMKKDINKIISRLISDQIVNYYFKEGKLYLYLPDDSLLVFKKM